MDSGGLWPSDNICIGGIMIDKQQLIATIICGILIIIGISI